MIRHENAQPAGERTLFIDVFRGVAILLVTAHHLWFHLGKPSLVGYSGARAFDAYGLLRHGYSGVDLFFFISGFCMASVSMAKLSVREGWSAAYGRYFLGRFLRVAPPYYVAILVWNIAIRHWQIAVKPTGWVDNVTHLLFVHNLSKDTMLTVSGVFWSIGVEMQFYVLLPLLLPLLRSHTWWVVAASWAVSIVVNVLGTDRVMTWSVLSFLPLFMVGAACALRRAEVTAVLSRRPVAVLLVAVTVGSLCYLRGIIPWGDLQRLVCGLLLGLTMIALSEWVERSELKAFGWLAWVGKISFSVYLYNYVFVAFRPAHDIYGWLGELAFVVGFGAIMYYAVEEPALALRRRVLARLRSRPRAVEPAFVPASVSVEPVVSRSSNAS